MAIEVTIEQIITYAGLLLAGGGGYWSLKAKVDALTRRDVEIEKDIDDGDKEVQKIWSKMLTTEGHKKECEIMNYKVERAIKESGDAVQDKVEETMVDFQNVMKAQLDEVLKAVRANGKTVD